jgi:hypothetical protein
MSLTPCNRAMTRCGRCLKVQTHEKSGICVICQIDEREPIESDLWRGSFRKGKGRAKKGATAYSHYFNKGG